MPYQTLFKFEKNKTFIIRGEDDIECLESESLLTVFPFGIQLLSLSDISNELQIPNNNLLCSEEELDNTILGYRLSSPEQHITLPFRLTEAPQLSENAQQRVHNLRRLFL